jgi:hypothetical protein
LNIGPTPLKATFQWTFHLYQATLAMAQGGGEEGTNLDFVWGDAMGHLISCVKCVCAKKIPKLKVLIFQSKDVDMGCVELNETLLVLILTTLIRS